MANNEVEWDGIAMTKKVSWGSCPAHGDHSMDPRATKSEEYSSGLSLFSRIGRSLRGGLRALDAGGSAGDGSEHAGKNDLVERV